MFHLPSPQKTSSYSNYRQRPRATHRAAPRAASVGTFTSSQVVAKCGVSYRQLQWWDEQNLISPRQEGHRRCYTEIEVRRVHVVAALRHKGVSLAAIRRALLMINKWEPGRVVVMCRNRWHVYDADDALASILETPGSVVAVRVP